ncbi:MAG TPA: hypothetical protein VFA26_03405, partial [Gemmataceae bacterium]|nr:hypothetical protein [Gemmataceae bacterium]
RRQTTAVYNVEPSAFENILARVLEGLGLSWTRAGNQLFIKYAPLPSGNSVAGTAIQAAPSVAVREAGRELVEGAALGRGAELAGLPAHPAVAHQLAVLEVDASELFHHVTLRWRMTEEPLRQEVESELRRLLAQTPTRTNLIGAWLLTLSAVLFAAIFVGLVLLILLNLRWMR